MKYIVLVLCFAAALAVVLAEEQRICKTVDDCDEGECCMSNFFSLSWSCKGLARENDACQPKKLDRHMMHCSCEEGLVCEGKDWFKNRCIKPGNDGDNEDGNGEDGGEDGGEGDGGEGGEGK
uniref:U75-Liphistoxin-Lsp1b_1 n=1 Tax=Liphistius sp. SGP-2016 TaxID=1905180 RepID=A0A4Q8K3C2_9ARAC